MICRICEREFKPRHWNQRLCSPECKREATRRAKVRYKKTQKGMESEMRWRANPEKARIDRKWRATSSGRKSAVEAAARYLQNHEYAKVAKRESDRKYARSNVGKIVNRAAQARYRRTARARDIRRIAKARRRRAEGSFSPEEWQVKLRAFGGGCAICDSTEHIEIDHIVPISRGGTNTIDNVQPLCRHCNASKGAKIL